MSTGEFPDRPSGELGVNPFLEIRKRCIEEVRLGLDEVRSQVDNGTFETSGYEGHTLDYLLRDVAVEAAQSGDLASAEANLDLLLQLPQASTQAISQACCSVASLGSQRAFEVLRGKLEAERVSSIADAASVTESVLHALRPYGMILDGVITSCEEAGTPPDSWIDNYAIDREHRWKLYTKHYASMAKVGTSEAEANQIEFERKVGELVADKSFDEMFVYAETPRLLRTIKNPELRERLLERYIEVAADMPLSLYSFDDFLVTAIVVIEDPVLATQKNINLFETIIESCAKVLREGDVDSYELMRRQLPWRLTLKEHQGATPQELVEHLDLQISQMLATDIPESAQGARDAWRNKHFVSELREAHLGAYASNSAEAGDFANARVFIMNLGSEATQAVTLEKCLKHVTTQEQIDIIKPDEMTLMFNPDLHMQFHVASALLESDTEALSRLALELVAAMGTDGDLIAHDYIDRIYSVVSQRQDSIAFTRNLLAALRAADDRVYRIRKYSEILIRAHDPDEPQRAYEEIDQKSLSISFRLRDLWKLARLLGEQQ